MERVIIDKSGTVLEIEVKTNVSKAIKDIDKLFRSLKKLEKIDVSNIEVLNKINSGNLIRIQQEIKSLNGEINRLQKAGIINFTSVANGLDSKNSSGIDTNILDKQVDSCIVLSDYISGVSLDFEKLIQDMASVDSLGELDKMFGNMLSNAFGPFRAILDDTLQHVIGFAEKVTEALGTIFGWKFEVESTGGTLDDWSSNAQNVATSTGVAAKNVEKMSKGVRAFDELNIITTQDTSYNSGGAGNSGASVGGEFVKTKTIWDNYKSDIDTLSKLGSYIGETLTKALNQINWSRIYEGARNFGKGLADFLNALISPDLFGAVGQTIAKALNAAIYAALSFGQNVDFKNFGYSIATAINNFFVKFDFKALAQTLNTWVNGIKQIIVTAITNIHWGDVFKGIGTFFSNLDVNTTFLLMIPAIKKLYPLLDNIVLTFTALSGNTAALSKLTEAFPRLGKVVKVAADSFLYLKMGIQDKQLFTGLNLGIENIRENLTGLQKGIIGAVAVVGEFKIISGVFEKLTNKSENFVEGIAKIGTAVVAVGAVMYTALGPAGIAITAVTGFAAALVGVTKAKEEMAQKLEESQQIAAFGDTVVNITAKIDEGIGVAVKRGEEAIDYVQNAGIAETMFAQDLAEKYFNLAEKESLTNKQKEQMQTLAKELVNTLPDLQHYYDTETGLLNVTRENIDNLIESRLKEIQLNAIEEKLTEEYKKRVDLLTKMDDATILVNQAQEKVNTARAKYDELIMKSNALKEYKKLKEQIAFTGDATGQLKVRQEELKSFLTDNGTTEIPTFAILREATANAQDEVAEMQKSYQEFLDSLSGVHGEYIEVEKNIFDLTEMMSETSSNLANNFVDNYSNGILQRAEDVQKAGQTIGNVTNLGVSEGIDKNIELPQTSIGRTMTAVLQVGNDSMKVMKELGENAIGEYSIGLESETYKDGTINAISCYTNAILDEFSKVIEPLNRIGIEAMNGLNNGLSSMEDSIYVKAGSIAGNIAKTVMAGLQINSPSRVMFRLGGYTMQGFQNGLENLYQPILSSVQGFSNDLQYASAPSLADMYGTYQYLPIAHTSQYDIAMYYQNKDYVKNNNETNLLLKQQNQLLRKILEKPNIGDNDIFNATKTVYRQEARRLGAQGNPAVVWG